MTTVAAFGSSSNDPEVNTMNDAFDAARLHREDLDQEIESIRMERFIRSGSASGPSLPGRARAGIGRRLISLGTTLVGGAEAAAMGGSGPRARAVASER
jgi:hypothetical protein